MVAETADDLWSDAANNNNDSEAHHGNKSSFQAPSSDPFQTAAADADAHLEDVDPDGCGFHFLYLGLKLWHGIDIIVGFSILLYGSLLSSHNTSVETLTIVVVIGVGILVTVRALSGTLALRTESTCQRVGLTLSSGTSPVLASTWFVLMCIQLIAPGHVQNYMQHHKLLWTSLQHWEVGHKGTVTLLFLGAFFLECVRWYLVQSLSWKLDSLEAQEDARERATAERRNRMPARPWWWRRHSQNNANLDPNDPLTDSLLPITADQQEGGETNNHPSWSFFGRRNHNSTREDASVSFASVQDEWASRSEEDPYWWSREANANTAAAGNSAAPPTNEISWTQEGNL